MVPRDIADAETISVETYKKDGSGVRTPVTPMIADGKIYVITKSNYFKIRRALNNSNVKIAACSHSGRQIKSDWYPGTTKILLDKEYGAMIKKLRKIRLAVIFSALWAGRNGAIMEISLNPTGGAVEES